MSMDDLTAVHLRLTHDAKARATAAANRVNLPLTAFMEAVITVRADELAADPDVVAHGSAVEANRRNRKRT